MMKSDRLTTPAASMMTMLERSHENRFTNSIKAAAQIMMVSGILFFGIFLIILRAASRIRMPTPTLIPRKAFATKGYARKLSRKLEIR